MMNLLCLWRQRTLAKAAMCEGSLAEHSRLQAHLHQCPSCHRFWKDIQSLTGELVALAEPLPADDGFADSVWMRLSAAPVRARRLSALVPVTAATACVALGLFLWNRGIAARYSATPSVLTEPRNQVTGGAPVPPRAVKEDSPPLTKKQEGKRVAAAPSSGKKRRERGTQVQKRSWKRSEIRRIAQRSRKPETSAAKKHVAQQQAEPETKQVVTAPLRPTPEQWQAWGVYYESQGDYERAAAAYGHAYSEQPDPSTAFAAGRAAERAGDVTQALVYYTRILNHASDKNASDRREPQKGTFLWSHENTSA